MKYEDLIAEIDQSGNPNEEAKEAATDAMALVLSLHNVFKENGVDLPEEPDCALLDSYIDSVQYELVAACLFLSETGNEHIPKLLRGISKSIETMDTNFEDVEGSVGPSVPVALKTGFDRLARRIEATKAQKAHMAKVLDAYKKSRQGVRENT
jgi:hypothetical protein